MKKRGHVGMWLDVDGEPIHVLADPNMSEETANALREITRAVRRMDAEQSKPADLDEIEREHHVSARHITMRPPQGDDVQVNADAHEVIEQLKAAGYVVVEGGEP